VPQHFGVRHALLSSLVHQRGLIVGERLLHFSGQLRLLAQLRRPTSAA
jgi:hypothetical protein